MSCNLVRFGPDRFGSVCIGSVRTGSYRIGSDWTGSARIGSGSDRRGRVRNQDALGESRGEKNCSYLCSTLIYGTCEFLAYV